MDEQRLILIVEDDEATRAFLAENIAADGFRVASASSAAEGLRAIEVRRPSPVLLDLALEAGSGLDLLDLLHGKQTMGLYADCENRHVRPIMPLRMTPAVKAGADEPPKCEHGRWQFAGSDYKRKASKWRCPTGECKPASVWIKASRIHPLIPRDSERWQKLPPSSASSDG